MAQPDGRKYRFTTWRIFKDSGATGNAATADKLFTEVLDNQGRQLANREFVPNTVAEFRVRIVLDEIGATRYLLSAKRICKLLGGVVTENIDGSITVGASPNTLADNAANYYGELNAEIMRLKLDIAKELDDRLKVGYNSAESNLATISKFREIFKSKLDILQANYPITDYERVIDKDFKKTLPKSGKVKSNLRAIGNKLQIIPQ